MLLLSTLGALLLSAIFSSSLTSAQQQQTTATANSTNSNSTTVASQYGDSFKNLGGKVLLNTVNGKTNKHWQLFISQLMFSFLVSICDLLRKLDVISIAGRTDDIFRLYRWSLFHKLVQHM